MLIYNQVQRTIREVIMSIINSITLLEKYTKNRCKKTTSFSSVEQVGYINYLRHFFDIDKIININNCYRLNTKTIVYYSGNVFLFKVTETHKERIGQNSYEYFYEADNIDDFNSYDFWLKNRNN